MIEEIQLGTGSLSTYFVEDAKAKAAHKSSERIVLLFYGAPSAPQIVGVDNDLYLEAFATRLSVSSNSLVGVVLLRGVGESSGVFSPLGWTQDIQELTEQLCAKVPNARVFLVGFELASVACLAAATELDQVAGVATVSIVPSVPPYGLTYPDLANQLQNLGVAVSASSQDIDAWEQEFASIDPVVVAPRLGSTPWLVIHGSNDAGVPEEAVRKLLEDVAGFGELHLVSAGGDSLRADPRVLALLVGWIARTDSASQ